MKVTVTGSLGNISKPLAEELVQKGHTVTVISSNPEKQKDTASTNQSSASRQQRVNRTLLADGARDFKPSAAGRLGLKGH